MDSSVKYIIAASTALRLLTSFALSNDIILTQIFGLGVVPAMRAAILDPTHTWDHIEGACFLLKNGVSQWRDERMQLMTGYRAIYTHGSGITAPPLVVAFLGEALASLNKIPSPNIVWIIQRLLLLLADAVGAYCIYHIGKRVYEMEKDSIEEEIERETKRCQAKTTKFNNLAGDADHKKKHNMIIPMKLRPIRGWIFGLSTLESDEVVNKDEKTPHINGKEQNGNSTKLEKESSIQIAHRKQKEPILTLKQIPLLVSLLYFSNPISMIANCTGSLRSLWDALALVSLYYATKPSHSISKEGIPIKIKSMSSTAAFLALATYVDVGYAKFLVPILLWRGMWRGQSYYKGQNNDWQGLLMLYVGFLAGLHYLASLLLGGSSDEYKSVMAQTILPNVAFLEQDASGSVPGPSMGLHWYFFVQMFDRFRSYFTVFVAGVPAMFILPLTIRLHRYPSVLVATFPLLWSVFRPTTTVHNLTLGLLLAMLNPRTIVRMRNSSLISLFALPVPVLLFITFHRMWLVTGNGNPNYIYFQCFAYGLFVSTITLDFISASVKRDKVLRMAEKGDFNVKDEVEGEKGEPDSKNRPGSAVDNTEELEGIDDDLKNKSDAKSNGKAKDDDENEEEEEEAEKPAIVFL
jgi:phosphatidylinositol glycan class U